jgi:hypothetical protein
MARPVPVLLASLLLAAAAPAFAGQDDATAVQPVFRTPVPAVVTPEGTVILPPATKLEGFTAPAGTVVTIGSDTLRNVLPVAGVGLEVRELSDDRGDLVRGLVVRVIEDERRRALSYVDADEVPSLIAGMDALLQVTSNPTSLTMFRVQYATRGELLFEVFNTPRGETEYAIQAGRTDQARRLLTAVEVSRLREQLQAAQTRLEAADQAHAERTGGAR